jgi:hypothetical protein
MRKCFACRVKKSPGMKFQLRRMQNFRNSIFHSNANPALWSAKPTQV